MKIHVLTLFLLVAPVCISSLPAQQPFAFKHLEMKDGLSNSQINAMYKDSEGFLWFATASGLNRYDGHTIKAYRSLPSDSASLADNFIEDIQEDSLGRLWVMTAAGYVIYDPDTDRFDSQVDRLVQFIGIPRAPDRVYVDDRRICWFYLKGHALYRFRPGDGQAMPVGNLSPQWFRHDVTDIDECEEGLLLIDSSGNLFCVDRDNLTLRWQRRALDGVRLAATGETFTLCVERGGRVWAYSATGIERYDPRQDQWELRRLRRQTGEMVRVVAQDRYGRIWMGKDQEGIEIIDSQGRKTLLKHDPHDPRTLANNTIYSLYEDVEGTMWVGTYKKGVSYYNENAFKFALAELGDVHCLAEGADGAVWLGTNGEGLVRWDRRTGRHTVFVHRDGDGQTPSGNVIVTLLCDHRGRIWAGTYWGGLDCYDGTRFTHYPHRPGTQGGLAHSNVWALAEDSVGGIWIGTLGGGLQRLDPETGRMQTYDSANSGLGSDYVSSLCFTADGRLLVGTFDGLFVMDTATRTFRRHRGTLSGDEEFANRAVIQVCEDSRRRMWVATRGDLYVYLPDSDRLHTVPLLPDDPHPFVLGLVEDGQGDMWATVGSRLVRVKTEGAGDSIRFHGCVYTDLDGLQGGGFNQRSMCRLSTGEVMAGGLTGVNSFRPSDIRPQPAAPHVVFAGLLLSGKEVEPGKEYDGRVVLRRSLNRQRELTLDYGQNVFSVLLASDSHVLPEKTVYTYRLEGFSDEWMTDEGLRRATFTNLAPGTYRLRVTATGGDCLAPAEEAVLAITILPPWWRTGWAYAAYTLLLGLVLLAAFRAVGRRERNRYLLRRMGEDARRTEELNQLKFRFFTNVSHELRTPLTLIVAPLETLIREAPDERTASRLTLILRNAQRLLMLVNQLLDFRKSEMAGLKADLTEGDVVALVRGACDAFLALGEKQNVGLTFAPRVQRLTMAFDADKLTKVVMNLLSNAFKFTPGGGQVMVTLDVLEGEPETMELRVADTGVGIADADKERVFSRFYQVGHTAGSGALPPSTGSGIGLSLVSDFVGLHGGTVRVEDNPGGGSVFVVCIPVTHVEAAGREAGPVPADAPPAVPEPPAKGKPQVLVVDDNRDFVRYMEDALSLYFDVLPASDGQEALELARRSKPALVLSDLMMPVMDGNELCRRLKADPQTASIPFVLLTAKQSAADEAEGLATGADDYVTKPFHPEVLVLRLRRLVNLHRQGERRTRRIDPAPHDIAITSLDEKLVADAIAYVETHIARPDLSVEELSQHLSMSRANLYKKLMQITGKSPLEFIRIIRLKRAAQLLSKSQLNVSEIAYQVGFNNPKYFSKYFKEEFGKLPSEYNSPSPTLKP